MLTENWTMQGQEAQIGRMMTLTGLKKYACPKVQLKRDWYLECLDCPGKNTCPTGQRASILLEHSTKPDAQEPPKPAVQDSRGQKMRENIIEIFEQDDPVRALLETAISPKPIAIYQKINIWRSKYPELEKKYHMTEKTQFLWRPPLNSMTVPEILKELYPEQKRGEPADAYSEPEDDQISLEDFLDEVGDIQEETQADPEPDLKEEDISDARVLGMKQNSEPDISPMKAELEKKRLELEQERDRLLKNAQDIDQKIQAIRTVEELW